MKGARGGRILPRVRGIPHVRENWPYFVPQLRDLAPSDLPPPIPRTASAPRPSAQPPPQPVDDEAALSSIDPSIDRR